MSQFFLRKDIDDIEIESEEAAVIKKVVPDFAIEYTKLVRDSCKGCKRKFELGELRIMRFVPDVDENQNDKMQSGQAHWYHSACFVRRRSKIGWPCSGDLLPGFKRLCENDKKMVQDQIP